MNDYLKTVAEFIVEVNSTNSTNEKINIVKNYECLKDLLAIVYDKHIQFNITSNNIKKFRYVYLPKINNDDLFTMLNKLSSRELTGNSALAYVNDFIFSNIDYKDIIYKIIDKNLETRTDAKLLNKAFPNLIPEFSVALANSYSDYEDKVDFIKDRWLVSRKLDGCLHYDTIVEFEDGNKLKIGYVVENKIEGRIKSYNIKTRKVEYKNILNFMKNIDDINESSYTWYSIELDNGKYIQLTGNHRVWLPKINCYRRVDELTTEDYLLFK